MVLSESGYMEIYVNNEAQTPVYFDNLSVTRSSGNAVEVNAYYPYGMIIPLLSDHEIEGFNAYEYNGKEQQTELNWNVLDFGARMQDPTIGKWMVPDPLAEKYYSISPYVYCVNNPIRFIDPDGKKIRFADNVTFKQKVRTRLNFTAGWLLDRKFRKNLNTAMGSEHVNTISFKNVDNPSVSPEKKAEHRKLRPEPKSISDQTWKADFDQWEAELAKIDDHKTKGEGDGTVTIMGEGDKIEKTKEEYGASELIIWSHEISHIAEMNNGMYDDTDNKLNEEEKKKFPNLTEKNAVESQKSLTKKLNRFRRAGKKYTVRESYFSKTEDEEEDE